MKGCFHLAWSYMKYHPVRTFVLWSTITLMFLLPMGLRFFVTHTTTLLLDRSQKTPLLIGEKAGGLSLVLDSLYFREDIIEPIAYQELSKARSTDLGIAVPLHLRFYSNEFPIVGTELNYFSLRNLELSKGRQFAVLGECVIGANVAARRALGVGDHIISSPEEVFDIAGTYPLKMKITGILDKAGTADDNAVFVDIKTAWIIEGLAHGHDDLTKEEASSSIHTKNENHLVANASVKEYQEITANNLSSFHFHGDIKDFPITAILVFPNDLKSQALLMGRYLNNKDYVAVYEPSKVIESLLQTVFTIERIMLMGLYLMNGIIVIIMALVFILSIKLRTREFETIKRIGASNSFVTGTLFLEGGSIILAGFLAAMIFVGIGTFFMDDIFLWILVHNLS